MLNFMAFFGARGCVATSGQAHSSERKNNPTTALRYPWLRAPGVLVSRNDFWREVTIRARSRSKATEIKEAYFTCRSGESPSEVPSRASCGMFWVDSLTETQERTCCVISVHIAGALACTRLTYSLELFASTRKLKPRTHGHKAEITSPRWSAASEASEHQRLAMESKPKRA